MRPSGLLVAIGLFGLLVAGCQTQPLPEPPPPPTPAPAPPPPPPAPESIGLLPFEQAVDAAASALFSAAADRTKERRVVVVDPLIDALTGMETVQTRLIEARIVEVARVKFPQFDVLPISTAALEKQPLVIVGTFTPIDADGQVGKQREQFRICLAFVDLGRGTVVSKVLGRSEVDGVDTTPTAFYRESIVWSSSDPSIVSYTRTCEAARPGDAVEPLYRQRIVTAAVLREAILLYEAGNFQAAEELFRGAAQTAQGGQLRVLNGWFLSDWNLEKRDEAAEAARRLADYGLEQRGFAMMFSFPPGRASFDEDSKLTGAYMILLRELARKVAESNDCLLVVGHASRSGSEPYNERLSLARANYVKARLRSFSRQAGRKTTTEGVGSREVLVGTGTDDLLDALDRRVEVRVSACPS